MLYSCAKHKLSSILGPAIWRGGTSSSRTGGTVSWCIEECQPTCRGGVRGGGEFGVGGGGWGRGGGVELGEVEFGGGGLVETLF